MKVNFKDEEIVELSVVLVIPELFPVVRREIEHGLSQNATFAARVQRFVERT